MSNRTISELTYTVIALREKRKMLGSVVWDKAMSIERTLGKMMESPVSDEQKRHLLDIEESCAAIRATLQEVT